MSEIDGGGSENPSLAVSTNASGVGPDYILHVAWSTNNGGAGSVLVYNNNYQLAGHMTHQQIFAGSGPRSDPVIQAVNSSNRLYFALLVDVVGDDDELSLGYCSLPACSAFTYTDSALHPVDDFELTGDPDMSLSLNSDNVWVTFLGDNIKTRLYSVYPEIILLEYSHGDTFPITDYDVIDVNDVEEFDPRIVFTPFFYVLAWRTRGSSSAALQLDRISRMIFISLLFHSSPAKN